MEQGTLAPRATLNLSNEEAAALRRTGWPVDLLVHRSPKVVHSVAAFRREVLSGNHLEQAVLFPGGLPQLNLDLAGALPARLARALADASSVLDLLRNLGEDLEEFQGNLESVDPRTHLQHDVLQMAEDQQLLAVDEAQRLAREWWQSPGDQAFEDTVQAEKALNPKP